MPQVGAMTKREVSLRAIVAALANRGVTISPGRFAGWARDQHPPTVDVAFAIGEVLLDLGSPTSAGPIAALAAGGVRDLLLFLPRLSLEDPVAAVSFYALAPLLAGLTPDRQVRRRAHVDRGAWLLPEHAWGVLRDALRDEERPSRSAVAHAWARREVRRYGVDVDPHGAGAAQAALAVWDALAPIDVEQAWRSAWSVLRGWAVTSSPATFGWMQTYAVDYLADWTRNVIVAADAAHPKGQLDEKTSRTLARPLGDQRRRPQESR